MGPIYGTISTCPLITVALAVLDDERMVVPVRVDVGRQAFMEQLLQLPVITLDTHFFKYP